MSNWKDGLELLVPNLNGFFKLETDASNVDIGGVPVDYFLRILNSAEQNYGITEKEVLTSLWEMEKFDFYLMGKHFTVITDHKAIEHIKTTSEFGSVRIQRWFRRFERFNFDIKCKKGKEMVVVDALSRAYYLRNESLG